MFMVRAATMIVLVRLAADNKGRIADSSSSGEANGGYGNDDEVGGLVGENAGTITASHTTGGVHGSYGKLDHVGGLAGRNWGTITKSYATGRVDGGPGGDDRAGGLVGKNQGRITASRATGEVYGNSGDTDFVGGLVGDNAGSGIIIASYASGNVRSWGGGNHVGGLAGSNWGANATITASYATGEVDGGAGGGNLVGGLAGRNEGGTIAASYATGDADGGYGTWDYAGGLVGYNGGGGTITASYATGRAYGGEGNNNDDRVGGLVGENNSSTIRDSYATGIVSGYFSGKGGRVVGLNTGSGPVMTRASYHYKRVTSSWKAKVWDVGAGNQPPRLKWVTGYTKNTNTFTCDCRLAAGRAELREHSLRAASLLGYKQGLIRCSIWRWQVGCRW